MRILGIDSAGTSCGVALWHDGLLLGSTIKPMERGQDQNLLPMIEALMRTHNLSYDALDRIAVTRGPGSFTGLRIGIATARGLGLAAHKPIVGIDRFSLYQSYFNSRTENVLVVIGAKRKECFVRLFPEAADLQFPTMMTLAEIEAYMSLHTDTLLCGDDEASHLKNYRPILQTEIELVCLLASKADPASKVYEPTPLYIRAPDVTFKKAQRIVRFIKVDDADTVATIHQRCFGSAGWDTEQLESSLRLPTTMGLSLLLGKETIGFILIQKTQPTAEIITFAVLPNFQRQRMGLCLLTHLLEFLKKNGFQSLDLDVAADNEAAKNLYEKIGFKRIGTRRGYYHRGQDKVDALQYRFDFKNDTFATLATAC